jgi:hypothetical protein
MEALDNRLRACSNHLRNIHSTYDLGRLTLDAVVDLKSFCVAEEEIMTKICMVDLYHIIGMGELTPPQMMKFTYALQKYQHYRPTIKAITKWSGSILDLPKIPVETQYKLMGLGDLTLTSGFGDPVVDDASVEDYDQMKRNNLLPFKIEGRQIKVDMTQFDFFVTLMTNISKSPLKADNFRKKLATGGEYLGIEWISCDAYEAVGRFKSEDIYTRLSGYYNKRG